MVYINRKQNNEIETADEFQTTGEANNAQREHQLSDSSARYYVSQRACKDWRTN